MRNNVRGIFRQCLYVIWREKGKNICGRKMTPMCFKKWRHVPITKNVSIFIQRKIIPRHCGFGWLDMKRRIQTRWLRIVFGGHA